MRREINRHGVFKWALCKFANAPKNKERKKNPRKIRRL
jgi:hypothetical protein